MTTTNTHTGHVQRHPFLAMLPALVETDEWKDYVQEVGSKETALTLLYFTALMESNLRMDLVSSRGAKGMFGFLPSTITLFKKKYQDLPPWSSSDVLPQARYAARHLMESWHHARHHIPAVQLPQTLIGSPLQIQKARFYYHNGTSDVPRFPSETTSDQTRFASLIDGLVKRFK